MLEGEVNVQRNNKENCLWCKGEIEPGLFLVCECYAKYHPECARKESSCPSCNSTKGFNSDLLLERQVASNSKTLKDPNRSSNYELLSEEEKLEKEFEKFKENYWTFTKAGFFTGFSFCVIPTAYRYLKETLKQKEKRTIKLAGVGLGLIGLLVASAATYEVYDYLLNNPNIDYPLKADMIVSSVLFSATNIASYFYERKKSKEVSVDKE